ncbi:MAG: hypothetical protein WBY67_22950, partial [Pseudolabrys sp.]
PRLTPPFLVKTNANSLRGSTQAFVFRRPPQQKIRTPSKKNPDRLQGRSRPTRYLQSLAPIPSGRAGVCMKDTVTRIAGFCLDIGIIVLVFVSLFWKWPAINALESPLATPREISHAHEPR